METERMWRYPAAAAFLGLPPVTIRGLVHRRAIPHYRLGPRTVLFSPYELRAWLAAQAVAAKAPTSAQGT